MEHLCLGSAAAARRGVGLRRAAIWSILDFPGTRVGAVLCLLPRRSLPRRAPGRINDGGAAISCWVSRWRWSISCARTRCRVRSAGRSTAGCAGPGAGRSGARAAGSATPARESATSSSPIWRFRWVPLRLLRQGCAGFALSRRVRVPTPFTSSFPRKRESRGQRIVACPWPPAFAGVTKEKATAVLAGTGFTAPAPAAGAGPRGELARTARRRGGDRRRRGGGRSVGGRAGGRRRRSRTATSPPGCPTG